MTLMMRGNEHGQLAGQREDDLERFGEARRILRRKQTRGHREKSPSPPEWNRAAKVSDMQIILGIIEKKKVIQTPKSTVSGMSQIIAESVSPKNT